MKTLACAVCLYEMRVHLPAAPMIPEEAVTIANGQAMCTPHFIRTVELISPDYGPVSLRGLYEPIVQRGSINRYRAESTTPGP